MRICHYGWDREIELFSIVPNRSHIFLHYKKPANTPNPECFSSNEILNILHQGNFHELFIDSPTLLDIDYETLPALYIENAIIQLCRIQINESNQYATFEFARLVLTYYRSILIKNRIELALINRVPHLSIDYLYCLAAYTLDIKCIALAPLRGVSYMWAEQPIQDTITFQIVDPLNGSVLNKNVLSNLNDFDIRNDSLLTHAKSLLYQDTNQSYGKDKYSNLILNSFKKEYKQAYEYIDNEIVGKTLEFISKLKYEYELLSTTNKDISKISKYIFLPLHKQPEMSTNPRAGNFWSQRIAIYFWSYIANKLGAKLIVKEHPHIYKWGILSNMHFLNNERFPRQNNFYKICSRIDNLIFASLSSNSNSLASADSCLGVVTTEGTIGAISALKGKPTFTYGDPWYRNFRNSHKIESYTGKTVEAILEVINTYKSVPNRQDIELDRVSNYCESYNSEFLVTINVSELNQFLCKFAI